MADKKTIMVVCTGNTCRSPMAEGWVKNRLVEKGLDPFIEVYSCGTGTRDGMPVSSEAVLVMRNREIEISGYSSNICHRDQLLDSDLIIAMNEQHGRFIQDLLPEVLSKTIVLDIPDPVGASVQVYEECIQLIERRLEENWDRIAALAAGV